MNLEAIIGLYCNSGQTNQITEKLNSGGKVMFRLEGLTGSSPSFIAASVVKQIKNSSHLFILPDKEEAAYFFNDLQTLLGEKHILFFPSSYKRPYQVEETDNANILQRAEVLNSIAKILNPESLILNIVVTYAEAISEKVVTKSHLSKNTLTLRQGRKTFNRFCNGSFFAVRI